MGDDGRPRWVTAGSLTRGIGPLYRITPKSDGARPFTVNAQHILVLVNNTKPRVKKWGSHCWRVLLWLVDATNRMVESVHCSYPTEDEAKDEVEALINAGWEPLEWEVSVEEYLAASYGGAWPLYAHRLQAPSPSTTHSCPPCGRRSPSCSESLRRPRSAATWPGGWACG